VYGCLRQVGCLIEVTANSGLTVNNNSQKGPNTANGVALKRCYSWSEKYGGVLWLLWPLSKQVNNMLE